jgi:PAS domain S-box-containing protein
VRSLARQAYRLWLVSWSILACGVLAALAGLLAILGGVQVAGLAALLAGCGCCLAAAAQLKALRPRRYLHGCRTAGAAILHETLESLPLAVALTRGNRVVDCNRAFDELFGKGEDGGRGLAFETLAAHPAGQALLTHSIRALPAEHEPLDLRVELRRHDGTTLWCRVMGRPCWQPGFAAGDIAWAILDIDAVKRGDTILMQALLELQATFDNALTGIAFLDPQGVIRRCNRRAAALFGWSVEELTGQNCRVVHASEQTLKAFWQVANAALAEQGAYAGEMELLRRDGQPVWCALQGKRVSRADPDQGTVWVFEDISARKAAEQALRESEARFRELVELSSDEYWEQDAAFRFLVSPMSGSWLQSFPPDHLLGRTRWELPGVTGPSEQEWAEHRAVLEAHRPFRQFEYALLDAQGQQHWVSVNGVPVFERDGSFAGYRGTGQDITARKRAELALRQLALEQQAVLDSALVGIAIGRNRVIQRCNRGFEQMFGYEAGELIGHNTRMLFPSEAEYRALGELIYPVLQRGETAVADVRYRRKDGRLIWCSEHLRWLDPQDQGKGVVWVVQDITARKQAEQALAETSSQLEHGMAALARLNLQMTLLSRLSNMLQSCLRADEIYHAFEHYAPSLFPDDSGSLFVLLEQGSVMMPVVHWGVLPPQEAVLAASDCWALRRGRLHRVDDPDSALRCSHSHAPAAGKGASLCIPIVAQSETLGLLNLRLNPADDEAARAAKQQLAVALAEQAALALAGMRQRGALSGRARLG